MRNTKLADGCVVNGVVPALLYGGVVYPLALLLQDVVSGPWFLLHPCPLLGGGDVGPFLLPAGLFGHLCLSPVLLLLLSPHWNEIYQSLN